MNRATHGTNAEAGAAEIQVVIALWPPRCKNAEHIVAVSRLHFAHRAVAAPARMQTRKIVPALVGLCKNRSGNVEHQRLAPSVSANFGPCGDRDIDKYQTRFISGKRRS